MGDPTGFVGAVAAELLHRAMEAAERAVEWPQHCAKLKQQLLALRPLVAEINRQEAAKDPHAFHPTTRQWLLDLESCLREAESVLVECADPKHRCHPIARSRSASKLVRTIEKLKDLLQTEVVMGMHLLQLEATDQLRQQVAQLSLGLEAHNLLTSQVFDRDRTFYNLKNGMGRLARTTSLSPHLGSSPTSSNTGTGFTNGFDSEALEEQPLPRFVFGMDKLNEQIQEILLGSEKIPAASDDDDGGKGYIELRRGSRWVGVWARGGAGKTLLVQQAMNNPIVAAHFDGRVYSIVVGRAPNVVSLQEKLCNKILLKFWSFKTSPEGKSQLHNLLQGKKCLLILDDVWEEGILDNFDVLSEPGSFILVTTRNRPVLQGVHATEVGVPELSSDNSMKLLCVHAFNGIENLPDHLEDLVRSVVAECKGLPLSLKVVGCALAEKKESHVWEMALQRLQDAEVLSSSYEEQLFHRLKLSYDDLGSQQYKECFLYFAAFPEDDVIEAEHLVQLWAGEGLIGQDDGISAEIEGYCILGVLIGRSLVDLERTWSKDQSMAISACRIHDVLRDMGLYIIQKGLQAWEQSCLFKAGWHPADGGTTDDALPPGWLAVGNVKSRHRQGCTIMQAQKLSLMGSTLASLPSKMGVKGASPPLRVLLLCGCRNLNTLDGFLRYFTNLCVLDLSRASKMRSLPRALGKLRQLVVLNLQSSGIVSLPQEISKLNKLEYLNLQDCNALTHFPVDSLSKLVSLKYFNTRSCGHVWDRAVNTQQGSMFPFIDKCFIGDGSLEDSPLKILSSLTNLRKLWIGSLNQEVLPDETMGNLSQIRVVSLRFPKLKELPQEMSKLSKVETLDLNYCQTLKELPSWVPETMVCVKTLDLRGCMGFSQLPATLGSMQSLIKLELSICSLLRFLPQEFGHSGSFPKLQELWLSACARLEAFPELEVGAFPRLFILDLFDCMSLRSLPESISYLGAKLRILNLNGCKHLTMPSDATLAAWIKLEELNLKGLLIKTLPRALASLPSLRKLNVSSCSVLESLPEHDIALQGLDAYFPNLQELIAVKATSLTNIPVGLVELPQLRKLDITGCESLVVTDEVRMAVTRRKGLQVMGLPLTS